MYLKELGDKKASYWEHGREKIQRDEFLEEIGKSK